MNYVKSVFRANFYGWLRCFRRDSRGSLIVITAILFPVLLAFLGLALDVGMIYDVKRRQQKAADAGAMGGGHELWRNNITDAEVTRAATDDTARNGFDDADGSTTVTVTYPYNTDQVEVVIEEVVPTYFARIFGPKFVTVRSRAVSGLVSYGDGCIFVMDDSARDAFKISGTADLRSECGVYVNSDHPDAAGVQGGTSCLDVPELGLVGRMNYEGSSQECTSDHEELMARVADPLYAMDPPDLNDGLTDRGAVSVSEGDPPVTLEPGIYDDITITGGTVTLNPGLYVIDGGNMPGGGNLTVNGGTVDGTSGVTFYLTNTSGDDTRWPEVNIAGNGQTPCAENNLCGGGGGGGFGSQKTNAFDPVGTSAAANGTVAAQGQGGGGGGGGGGGEGRINLVAPSSATLTVDGITGMLFFYDRNAPLGPPTISNHIVGDSCSTFQGGLYFLKTDLAFRGTSSSNAWQMVVANTMEIMGTSCAYNTFEGTFAGMPPVRTVTLME